MSRWLQPSWVLDLFTNRHRVMLPKNNPDFVPTLSRMLDFVGIEDIFFEDPRFCLQIKDLHKIGTLYYRPLSFYRRI